MVATDGSGRAPGNLNWNVASARNSSCTLAAARATPTQIVISFGARRRLEPAGEAPVPVCALALSPLTAKNLAATLRRLIEDHDGAAR